MEKTITCYQGMIERSHEGYKNPKKFNHFLYEPKEGILIECSTNGSSIGAIKIFEGTNIEKFLKGEKIKIPEKIFKETVNKCGELLKAKFHITDLFYQMFDTKKLR